MPECSGRLESLDSSLALHDLTFEDSPSKPSRNLFNAQGIIEYAQVAECFSLRRRPALALAVVNNPAFSHCPRPLQPTHRQTHSTRHRLLVDPPGLRPVREIDNQDSQLSAGLLLLRFYLAWSASLSAAFAIPTTATPYGNFGFGHWSTMSCR